MRKGLERASPGCKRVLRYVVTASLLQSTASFILAPIAFNNMAGRQGTNLRYPKRWPLVSQRRALMMSGSASFGSSPMGEPADCAGGTLSKNIDEITEVVAKKYPYIPKQLVHDMVARSSRMLKQESPAVVEKLLAGTMAKSARDEIRDNYAASLNQRIDLPVLNEAQEEILFRKIVDIMFDILALRSSVSEGIKGAAKALDLTERTLTFMDKVEALMAQATAEMSNSGKLLSTVSIFLGKVSVFLLLCKLHWKLAFLFLVAANFVGTQSLFLGFFSLLAAAIKFLFSDNPVVGVGLLVVWGLHDFGFIDVPVCAATVSGHLNAAFLKVADVNGDGIFSFADVLALFRP